MPFFCLFIFRFYFHLNYRFGIFFFFFPYYDSRSLAICLSSLSLVWFGSLLCPWYILADSSLISFARVDTGYRVDYSIQIRETKNEWYRYSPQIYIHVHLKPPIAKWHPPVSRQSTETISRMRLSIHILSSPVRTKAKLNDTCHGTNLKHPWREFDSCHWKLSTPPVE